MTGADYETLARDAAATQWVDVNVDSAIIERIQRWARMVIDKRDVDDQAAIGVLLTTVHNSELQGGGTIRGHAYGLIFTYPEGDERKQVCETCFLRVNDANQVVAFVETMDTSNQ
jgi:predicted proteasome-type protease